MAASSRVGSRLRLILGTMDFGRRALAEDKVCHGLLSTLYSKGVSELDTAFMYVDGASEESIGRYDRKRDYIVATKANPWSPEGPAPLTISHKYARVLEEMRISLERLQMSSVDIFYLHAPDATTPVEETLSAVQKLYEEGKFKEFGLSNFASWQVAEVHHICDKNGWIRPSLYQGMYNPITRAVEGELFPCLRNYKMRFYAFNPLAGGLLTGKYKYSDLHDKDNSGRFHSFGSWSERYVARFWRESLFNGIDKIKDAIIDNNSSIGDQQQHLVAIMVRAAFQWLNHHSMMEPDLGDGIIVGGSSSEYILNNVEACGYGPLEQNVVDAFEEAWQLDKGHCETYYR